MKPAVLVYRSELLPASETFILAQTGAMQRYRPVFAGSRLVPGGLVPAAAAVITPPLRPVSAARLLYRHTGLAPGFASRIAAHRPQLAHAHFALDAAEALPLVRALRLPLVVTLHGYDVMCADQAHAQTRAGRLYLARRPQLFARADIFLCVSRAIRDRAQARGFPAHKLRVLPCGIDINAFTPGPAPAQTGVVLFVGRLVEKKGCHILLRAMQRVQEQAPQLRLVVAGDGPARSALEAQAAEMTVGTRFFGTQTADGVRALMREARCLVAPSLTAANGDAEGLPTVLAEALAAGLPVASTVHAGIPELIRQNREGLLAPEGDAETLAANLLALCLDDALAERLRMAGRARVEQHFDLHRQTAELEELYAETIAAHRSVHCLVGSLAVSAPSDASPVDEPAPYTDDAEFSPDRSPLLPVAAANERARPRDAQPPVAGRGHRLRHQAAWLLSGSGVATLCQALYFLLMGRMLGAHEYGAFAGAVALVNVGSQFSSLGMEMVLLRAVARDRASFAASWTRALILSGAGFLVLLAAILVYGALFLPPSLRQLLPWLVCSDALFGKVTQLASRAFQGADMARRSAKLLALTNAARAAAAGVLALLCLHHHGAISALLWARVYLGASLLVAVSAFRAVTRHLGRPARASIRRAHIAEGLSFSFSSSAISVYNDIDKTLLAGYGMLGAAGIYAAAYRVIDVVSTPIYSVFAAASPRLFRQGAEEGPRGAARGARRLLGWSACFGALAAPALTLAAPALPYLFGHTFSGSVAVLRFLCFLPLLRALHYAWGTAITACTSQWVRTGAQAAVALLNLGMNLWLIPRWGWRGAATASLASDGALALLCFLLLRIVVARSAENENRLRGWRPLRGES